jgi:Protein of unknown function (DUF1460)
MVRGRWPAGYAPRVVLALAAALVLSAGPLPGRVAALLTAAGDSPAGGPRAAAATAPLLGTRYRLGPLGEGRGLDPDPRFRLDAFDCVTFVETALALGAGSSEEEVRRALDDIRYGRTVDIADRDHEVLSQWIPRNVEKGWIRPISRELAGDAAVEAATVYDRARWAQLDRRGHRLDGVPAPRLPVGRFATELVPTASLGAVESRLPDGAVVWAVRAERIDQVSRITHGGLVVVKQGRRWIRHASASPSLMRVVEEPLAEFVKHQRRASSRPLIGLAVFAAPDNRARLADLPPLAP